MALSEACTKIESHPFKAHVTKPVAEMFDTLGRYSNFTYRMIFANLWLFGDVLDSICRKSGGELNALMRTTVAFTQAKGSAGRNVIPPEAAFISNLRLNPEDTMDSALAYLKETINDPAVEITKLEGMNPSRISETNCPAWDKVASAVAGTWKGCLVAPYLMVQCSGQPPLRPYQRPCVPFLGHGSDRRGARHPAWQQRTHPRRDRWPCRGILCPFDAAVLRK